MASLRWRGQGDHKAMTQPLAVRWEEMRARERERESMSPPQRAALARRL